MVTRQRRTPQAAKFAILDAAERRLHDEGPEGVRIQRIAADLGITDAAVHYHFGTREALMDALLRRIGRRLVDDIEATIESWAPDQIDVAALSRLLQQAYANERAARLALARGQASGKSPTQLSVLLTSEARIRALNKQHRGKDKATNVLSFPAAAGVNYLGDIAIAYGVALREAESAGKPLLDHGLHLVIHGVLHLLGYDHEEPKSAEIMESLEAEILAQIGIANPYKRRTRAA